MHTISEKKLLLLRPEDILSSPDRPRKDFSEHELCSLAKSITANGIIEPLCVRKGGKGRYVLLSGERRLRAAKMAGIRRIPCVVHNTGESDAAIFTLIENLQREELNFFEEAAAIDRVLGVYGITENEMASRLGIQKEALKDKLRLLKISRLDRERILAAGLTKRHAAALLELSETDIPAVLDAVIGGNLSGKETEELVHNITNPPEAVIIREPPQRKAVISDIKFFSNSLSKLLGIMQNAGAEVSISCSETEDYAEYEVRIEKNTVHQLTIAGI